MSLIAEQAGISRATLYKYFPGVDEILVAAHAEHVQEHLAGLRRIHDSAPGARQGLEGLIEHYVEICHHRGRGAADVSAVVHSGDQHHVHSDELHRLFVDAVRAAQTRGEIRTDLSPDLLASYCLKAAEAASGTTTGQQCHAVAALIKESLGPEPTP